MKPMLKKGSVTINLSDPEFLKIMLDAGKAELRRLRASKTASDREFVERILRACVDAKVEAARKTLAARKVKTSREWKDANPDMYRAQTKRYGERIEADPERQKARREYMRTWRERNKGKKVEMWRKWMKE